MIRALQISLAATIAVLANAAPLDKKQVANDASWLAHLDLQALQETTIGEFLLGAFEEEFGGDESSVSFDMEGLLGELQSVTAYGAELGIATQGESVLVARTGEKAKPMIDAYIATQELEKDGKTGFKKLDGKDYLTYLVGNEVYLAFPSDGLVMASRSFEQVERALAVLDGDAKSLNNGDSELILTDTDGYFFLASANGIDSIDGVPPQAKLLQKAKGGQIALGERDDNLVSKIRLSTSGPEVSGHLASIAKGLVALASFTEVGGERLDRLMNSVEVESEGDMVSISLDYPADEIVRLLTSIVDDGPGEDDSDAESQDGKE